MTQQPFPCPFAYTGIAEAPLMDLKDRIALDPAVLAGKPIVKGTRMAVEFIIGLLAQGWTEADVLRSHPGLVREDVLACLAYAQVAILGDRMHSPPAGSRP